VVIRFITRGGSPRLTKNEACDGLCFRNYELIFVTMEAKIKPTDFGNLAQEVKAVRVINFSSNFGHQIAITAGWIMRRTSGSGD
jgi:hypothetical protein